ncbi:hypothetical protein GTP46_25840 [Duganella sp. FT135W]|uniref:Uncharacterized protein n=1 Tax=Duganella flavida TaxID=2692175 RepID=A0A6L8KF70_9BURK|nr:hypothetical protein [Duganella flavida]MYM26056.1 hypothetical protein [Duganella flavida]
MKQTVSAIFLMSCFLICPSMAQTGKSSLAVKKNTDYLIVDYTAINFETNESELVKMFPSVRCEQMPNPQVRMCRLPVAKGQSISYLYFSGKLININGRTRTKMAKPPQMTCDAARAQFRACQQLGEHAFVDCLAKINAPPGCR